MIAPFGTPPPGRFLWGWPFVVLGVILDGWALGLMRAANTTVLPWGAATRLVTRGPFRFSRNPIYLGYTFTAAGVAVMLGTLWGWVMLLAALVVMDRVVIPREERHLAETFGEAFEEYRKRVRRWL